MRLIDADELKKLRHDCIQGRIKFDGNEYDLIDKCPTIEAEPVRHGRWKTYRNFALFANVFVCSECSYNYTSSENSTNYCPNCGAKMDLED